MSRSQRALSQLISEMAVRLGCSRLEARKALTALQRSGLLRIEGGRLVLPLARGASK